MKKWRYFLKMMVMLKSIPRVNGNVGNVIPQCENGEFSNSIEGAISLPTIPTLPLKDMYDNIPICPICKIEMKKRKCMGGYAMYCDNYWKCGQRIQIKSERGRKL